MADEPEKRRLSERLRRVRRRPGLEQLGAHCDGPETPPRIGMGYIRAKTLSDPLVFPYSATTMLSHRPQVNLEKLEKQKQKLEEQRALWESTLPKTLSDHISYFSTGHKLDHVRPRETP